MEYLEDARDVAAGLACGCWTLLRNLVRPSRGPRVEYARGTTNGDDDDDTLVSDLGAAAPLVRSRPSRAEELTMSPVQKFRKYRRVPVRGRDVEFFMRRKHSTVDLKLLTRYSWISKQVNKSLIPAHSSS